MPCDEERIFSLEYSLDYVTTTNTYSSIAIQLDDRDHFQYSPSLRVREVVVPKVVPLGLAIAADILDLPMSKDIRLRVSVLTS